MKIIIIFFSIVILTISCEDTTEPTEYTICDLNGTWTIHVQKTSDSSTVIFEDFDLECKTNNVHAISKDGQYWNFLSDCVVKGNIIEGNMFHSKPLSLLTFNSKNSFELKNYDTNFIQIEFGTGIRL